MIHLIPLNGPTGNISGGEISNGSYRIVNKGGVLPGDYRVEFTAMRPIPPITLEDGSVIDDEQYLPKKFNKESQFVLTVPKDVSSLKQNFELEE